MTLSKIDVPTIIDRLVSIPSISSTIAHLDRSNRPVIDYLATCFEDLGFACELVPCGTGKLNLIASLGSGPGGLVLAGHTDTVPLDEPLWSVNPFKLTEREGKYYGLGTADMKSFFALIMAAVEPLRRARFSEPLIVLATADEETSMAGAQAISELGRPRARAAVIGEPTSLKPVKAHKGIMMDAVRLRGQSGHSSDPGLGNNALDAMYQVISELIQYRDELKDRYQCELFMIPYPTLNLGCIHGGDNPNRICGDCELQFDLRLTPGMDIDAIRAEIHHRLHRITEPRNIHFEMITLFRGVPAFASESDSVLLRTVEQMTGHQGIGVAFGTEAPYLQAMGMDTIVLGPGSIDQAHQPDEYIDRANIEPCIALLRRLIEVNCLNRD